VCTRIHTCTYTGMYTRYCIFFMSTPFPPSRTPSCSLRLLPLLTQKFHNVYRPHCLITSTRQLKHPQEHYMYVKEVSKSLCAAPTSRLQRPLHADSRPGRCCGRRAANAGARRDRARAHARPLRVCRAPARRAGSHLSRAGSAGSTARCRCVCERTGEKPAGRRTAAQTQMGRAAGRATAQAAKRCPLAPARPRAARRRSASHAHARIRSLESAHVSQACERRGGHAATPVPANARTLLARTARAP